LKDILWYVLIIHSYILFFRNTKIVLKKFVFFIFNKIFKGFDEYMNVVLDEAVEVSLKKKTRKDLG